MRSSSAWWSAATLFGAMLMGTAAIGTMTGCEETDIPSIRDIEVDPDTFSQDQINENNAFTIRANVTGFDTPIADVFANLEASDQRVIDQFVLTKEDDTTLGESWIYEDTLAVFAGLDIGNYFIRITATDAEGDRATSEAESITITAAESNQ